MDGVELNDNESQNPTDPILLAVLAVAAVAMLVAGVGSVRSALKVLPLALPWVLALWAATRRRVALTDRARRQFELVVAFAVAAPSLLLAITAFVKAPLHAELIAVVGPSAVLAAVLAAVLISVLPGARVLPALPLAVVGCLAYGYGAAVTANMLFDRSQPRLERVQLLDKWVGARSIKRPASEPASMLELERRFAPCT